MILRDADGDVIIFISEDGANTAAETLRPHYRGVSVQPHRTRSEMQGYCILFYGQKPTIL